MRDMREGKTATFVRVHFNALVTRTFHNYSLGDVLLEPAPFLSADVGTASV